MKVKEIKNKYGDTILVQIITECGMTYQITEAEGTSRITNGIGDGLSITTIDYIEVRPVKKNTVIVR